MMHYYLISQENRFRREEAQRQARRREYIALAEQIGNAEVSGLLPLLRRLWCRIRAKSVVPRATGMTTARGTAC